MSKDAKKKKGDKEPEEEVELNEAGLPAGPQLVSLKQHPAAAARVRKAKAWGGLIAFVLVVFRGASNGDARPRGDAPANGCLVRGRRGRCAGQDARDGAHAQRGAPRARRRARGPAWPPRRQDARAQHHPAQDARAGQHEAGAHEAAQRDDLPRRGVREWLAYPRGADGPRHRRRSASGLVVILFLLVAVLVAVYTCGALGFFVLKAMAAVVPLTTSSGPPRHLMLLGFAAIQAVVAFILSTL